MLIFKLYQLLAVLNFLVCFLYELHGLLLGRLLATLHLGQTWLWGWCSTSFWVVLLSWFVVGLGFGLWTWLSSAGLWVEPKAVRLANAV